MKNNNFDDEILNRDHEGVKYPYLRKLYNADFYSLYFDPDVTRFDEEVLNDDYEEIKYNTKMWKDIHPQ